MRKVVLALAASILIAPAAYPQCAGCGPDFNKAEREKAKADADYAKLKSLLPKGTPTDAHNDQVSDWKRTNDQTDAALQDDKPPVSATPSVSTQPAVPAPAPAPAPDPAPEGN
jgi:hypothetical protein